jgi:hypothetical protein
MDQAYLTMKNEKNVVQPEFLPPPPKEYLLTRYKCLVRVFEKELQLCRLGPTGDRIFTRGGLGWEPVTHPVGEDFLDAVNRIMETRYTEHDFRIAAYNMKSRFSDLSRRYSRTEPPVGGF